LTVTGAGSTLEIGFQPFVVGQTGLGSLVIADKSTVTTGLNIFGQASGSTGQASVTNSRWTVHDLVVGQDGVGTVRAEAGATLSVIGGITLGYGVSGNGTLTV